MLNMGSKGGEGGRRKGQLLIPTLLPFSPSSLSSFTPIFKQFHVFNAFLINTLINAALRLLMTNIYTPQQQRILLITSLIIIAGFIIYGLSGYISAFLGAGILYVVFRPWFTALAIKRNLQ